MTRRVAALVTAGAAVLALCVGCGDGGPGGSGRSTSELDQIQSTLDSVSAQVSADATP